MVLRDAGWTVRLGRHQRNAAAHRIAGTRLRRPHSPHEGLARLSPVPQGQQGVPRQTGRARGRDLGPFPYCSRLRSSAATSTPMPHRARWSATTSTRTPMGPTCWVRHRSTRSRTRPGRVRSRRTARRSWRRTASSTRPPDTRSWPTCSCSACSRSPASRSGGRHPVARPFAQTRPGARRAHRGGLSSRLARRDRGRPQRRSDGRAPRGRTGCGETLRHGARRDPVCPRRRGEVSGRAGCPFPRMGLGRVQRLDQTAPGPHGGRRGDRARHHGSDGGRLGNRLGLGTNDLHRRRVVHRGHAGQRGGACGVHLQPCRAVPLLDHDGAPGLQRVGPPRRGLRRLPDAASRAHATAWCSALV